MKKIIVIAVTALVAVVTNAATVNWQLAGVKDIDGNLIGATSGKYTAVATLFDSTGATELKSVTVTTSNAMSLMAGSFADTALSTSYMTQIVLTDASGNTLTSEKAAFTTSASATYTINFTNGTGFSTKTAKVDYAAGWVAAPEPTSGLLLLLGVAGLALKRKRA